MGDYGVSLASNIRVLSPVGLNNLSNNQSLFSADIVSSSTSTMQDHENRHETQVEKTVVSTEQSSPTPDSQSPEQNSPCNTVNVTQIESPQQQDEKNIESAAPAQTVVTTTEFVGLVDPASVNSAMVNSLPSQAPWSSAATIDDTFLQGFQALNGTVTFQNFPPPTNPAMFNTNVAPPQMSMGMPQQAQPPRRAITGGTHNQFGQQRNQPGNMGNHVYVNNSKGYPSWSNPPHQSWPGHQQQQQQANMWGNIQPNRRSVPNMPTFNPAQMGGSMRKQNMFLTPSKFRRSTSYPGHMQQPPQMATKPGFETFSSVDEANSMNQMSGMQDQNNYDSMRFPTLESQLLDIMRQTAVEQQQPQHQQQANFKARPYGRRRGKSPFGFVEDHHLLEDGSLDQTVPGSLGTPSSGSPRTEAGMERVERFSRKVFVGGLPPDIDEEEITAAFRRFGPLVVDWPHKAESKSYFPPKGYCFLLFQDELSVQALIDACIVDDGKLYWCVSSPTMKDKPVQIRPWNLSDSDFVMDGSQPLDPRKTIFVGGVPRPLRAVELAMIMDRLYGGVCYAGIDTDPELKYPKGAGRVAFSNQQSYIAAISARFVQLQHGDIDKRVEVKPYVLDDQLCDECQGARCGGKFAPFFCANVTCLQYYCEHCWAQIHSRPGREFHKPLVKEGADRPRAVPFRWC
ncbi:cytoplasmic polyadenylation element-binding protein 2 isoform X1 [Lingula anatina]|uniref:Cytoplasmic polyadenylation element-binding protein 2 isoform X1 n=1 Tax=Lingula anatina TaxID=7574 RepID=A0A1S3KD60_LINAN|nr:cytoplasmic polyadenylation element-binding protein 2 isoform X1 [Lingula anatina]|eukprot:XP_013420563.1 cytoplasmic polyadenylation element-binding protein 2 isoform X1 [Lingula anatina]